MPEADSNISEMHMTPDCSGALPTGGKKTPQKKASLYAWLSLQQLPEVSGFCLSVCRGCWSSKLSDYAILTSLWHIPLPVS